MNNVINIGQVKMVTIVCICEEERFWLKNLTSLSSEEEQAGM